MQEAMFAGMEFQSMCESLVLCMLQGLQVRTHAGNNYRKSLQSPPPIFVLSRDGILLIVCTTCEIFLYSDVVFNRKYVYKNILRNLLVYIFSCTF